MLQEATLTQLAPRFLRSPKEGPCQAQLHLPEWDWGYFCFGAAASKPGGEGQCSGIIYPAPAASHSHPGGAWAISSAQHTTPGRAEAASWRTQSLNSKSSASETDRLVSHFKGLFKLQLATGLICLLLCCTFSSFNVQINANRGTDTSSISHKIQAKIGRFLRIQAVWLEKTLPESRTFIHLSNSHLKCQS